MQNFEDFKKVTVPTRKNKLGKIRGSFGIYDVYKHIRKNKWYNIGRPLKEHEFYSIIREINNRLAEEIIRGNTVVFPNRMGKLELCKSHRGASIIDGKLKITYAVDWLNTLHLWHQDEEAKKSKILIRHSDSYVYKVKYMINKAVFNNKGFYQFSLNSFIKDALSQNIKNGKVDTLWKIK